MPEWTSPNNKGIAIVRVSSQRQRDNISHDAQESEIRSYCERHGIVLTQVYRIIESAKDSENRTQYQQAINQALASEIQHVCFYMYDREARNLTDNERNEKLVLSGILCLHYVRDNKVLHKNSSLSDFFIRDVTAVTNKQYSRALAVKVADATRQKAEQGWYPGNHPPKGYVHQHPETPEGRTRKSGSIIVPDPNPNHVRQVQREFELRSLGYSLRAIRAQIIKEGFIAQGKEHSYSHAIIEHRLKNPFYGGKFTWKGIEYPGKHELIIPQSTLRRVAMSFSARALLTAPRGEHGIFSGGWIRCSLCGCSVVYDPKKKKLKPTGEVRVHHYYHCTNGKRIHRTLAAMSVTEGELWRQFARVVDEITVPEDRAAQIARALNESLPKTQAHYRHEIEQGREQIRILDDREERAYEDLQSGVLDQALFIRLSRKLKHEKSELLHRIEGAHGALRGRGIENASTILELAKDLKSLYLKRNMGDRKELLDLVLSNPRWNGRSIEYELKTQFRILREMKQSENWLALFDNYRTACAEAFRF